MAVFFFFIFYFLAVLGLRFCARAFSSCGEWGPLFIAVRGPLTIAAPLVAEHRLQTRRLSNCGSRAQLLRGMWDLPRPRLEPVSPELAGRLSTTAPPGKPTYCISYWGFYFWNKCPWLLQAFQVVYFFLEVLHIDLNKAPDGLAGIYQREREENFPSSRYYYCWLMQPNITVIFLLVPSFY